MLSPFSRCCSVFMHIKTHANRCPLVLQNVYTVSELITEKWILPSWCGIWWKAVIAITPITFRLWQYFLKHKEMSCVECALTSWCELKWQCHTRCPGLLTECAVGRTPSVDTGMSPFSMHEISNQYFWCNWFWIHYKEHTSRLTEMSLVMLLQGSQKCLMCFAELPKRLVKECDS